MTEKNFIILDLEWNQSCDPEAADKKLQFEIIEIGAVRMDENRRMTGEFSQLIKPQIYHELNKITSRLIHMKMSQLRQGRPFPEVMEEFRAWCGKIRYSVPGDRRTCQSCRTICSITAWSR